MESIDPSVNMLSPFLPIRRKKEANELVAIVKFYAERALYGLLSFLDRLVNDPSLNLASRLLDLGQLG